MRLADLNPRFVDAGGPGIYQADGSPAPARSGVGLFYECPGCRREVFVEFKNPIDGGAGLPNTGPMWQRTGSTFDELTLAPSIVHDPKRGGCGWHGFIEQGKIRSC